MDEETNKVNTIAEMRPKYMVDEEFDYRGFHFQRLNKDYLWYVTYNNLIMNHGRYRNDLVEWIDTYFPNTKD